MIDIHRSPKSCLLPFQLLDTLLVPIGHLHISACRDPHTKISRDWGLVVYPFLFPSVIRPAQYRSNQETAPLRTWPDCDASKHIEKECCKVITPLCFIYKPHVEHMRIPAVQPSTLCIQSQWLDSIVVSIATSAKPDVSSFNP